ncbi:hypothetical protein [Terrimonas pollutisoli]|uniref:hypothetical protein n=1 Tax=Terrimonas pollutisoli TaxID=3034147 RepID=UPI0023EE2970|nr:hypothetical protein [Terrimonas sp. H1YJ31]
MPVTINQGEIDQYLEQEHIDTSILKILAYFDIFQYPLTSDEIRQFAGRNIGEARLEQSLQQLLLDRVIFVKNDFFSLHNNPLLAIRRKQGNRRAEKLLPKAFAIGRFLYGFPFVRAVGISGSLSKNFADEKADIDFFIITKANRLWIARTIMHLFKKLTFLTGHQHYFCMNYYIDEEALLIEEQNVFTAAEIATLIPVRGDKAFHNFFTVNSWSNRFMATPDHNKKSNTYRSVAPGKKVIEAVFDNSIGNRIDDWLQKITTSRWNKKDIKGERNKNGLSMKLITGKHFSRSNPGAFQERVVALYEKKLTELKLRSRV